MYIFNYKDFSLYESLNFLFEQEILFDKNFIFILRSISDTDEIAKLFINLLGRGDILDIDGEIKNVEEIHPHKSKPDFVEILFTKPNGSKAKSEMKLGKLITALLQEIKNKKINIKPQDIEHFVRMIYKFRSDDVDLGYEFKLVDGKDILKYYNGKNYIEDKGNLGVSCMKGQECQQFIKFYLDYCSKSVKLLILIDPQKDKIAGRALIWETEDVKYMDRIYVIDDKMFELFYDWGKKNGIRNFYEKLGKITMFIKCDNLWKEDTKVPYMDTFSIAYELDNYELWLSNFSGHYNSKKFKEKDILNELEFNNADGSYNIVKTFKLDWKIYKNSKNIQVKFHDLTSLAGCLERVNNFDCSFNKLISLEGGPQEANGYFNCTNNRLNFLKGAPKKIDGYFDCSNNLLTSLEGGPEEVGDSFYCTNNRITYLKGAPKKINGFFGCDRNELTSLQGAPEEVGDSFDCSDNLLISLKGIPKKIGGYFNCSKNKLNMTEEEIRKLSDIKGSVIL